MASKFELKQEYKNLVLQGKQADAKKVLKLIQSFCSNVKEVSKVVVKAKNKKK